MADDTSDLRRPTGCRSHPAHRPTAERPAEGLGCLEATGCLHEARTSAGLARELSSLQEALKAFPIPTGGKASCLRGRYRGALRLDLKGAMFRGLHQAAVRVG